jgi:5-methylthioadenosine/S-adenosylhomocysteine deaminase
MTQVDTLLSNALVLTMDKDFRIYPQGAVAIRDGTIVSVGPSQEILPNYPNHEIIDCEGKTLIPGLINAHTHVSMTLLRGLTDDRRLDVWLMGYMMPVERAFVSPDFVRLGAILGCAEMIQNGITCFADMYYFEETAAQAIAEVGMRAICGQTVLKFPSPDADSYEDAIESAATFIQQWKGHPLIIPAVAPHAPYTCTRDILEKCTQLALAHDVPLIIHLAETLQEVREWRDQYDMPVIPWVKKLGLLEAKVIAAHCVHIDEGEIHTLEHTQAGVVHNPSSNLKLASGFAPVVDMLEAGVMVGVGTDGPASNNDLDMFEELRLASFIAKAITKDPTALPAKTAFSMGTILGAKSLHIDHLTGSIEKGKRADIVLVDLNSIHTQPWFERDPDAIYSRLVYSAKSTDVTDVMVDGQWLMRNRRLTTIEKKPLLEAAAEYARKIDAFLIEREESVLSKLVAIGGAEQEESYEVQVKVQISDPEPILAKLEEGPLEILRKARYLEYDTYFSFDDPRQGRLRYREDDFVDEDGNIFNVRYRLTLIGPASEGQYAHSILLSRSRFIAPAHHSLRFYKEYFQPTAETQINKDRRRWLVRFRDVSFFVNLDQITMPATDGYFLEIKSRTWSRRDAEMKADLISELLHEFGVHAEKLVEVEYPDLVASLD